MYGLRRTARQPFCSILLSTLLSHISNVAVPLDIQTLLHLSSRSLLSILSPAPSPTHNGVSLAG
jgi:hypothetical protein